MSGEFRRIGLVLLLGVLLLGALGLLHHSHHSCEEDQDCVFCLLAATSLALLAVAPVVQAAVVLAGRCVARPSAAACCGQPLASPSRAPPAPF